MYIFLESEGVQTTEVVINTISKNMNLGKADLLTWINVTVETDYMSVQSLADGVAYAQVLDAVHPGSIAVTRLNFSTRYPQDNLRNLKIVEDALKKLKITQPASFQKMAKGMFQDNIIFLQWLYGYSNRNGADNLRYYAGYSKRQRILDRQGRSANQMNLHLLPSQNRVEGEEQEWQAGCQAQQQISIDMKAEVQGKIEGVDNYISALQNELKEAMQFNWRMMYNIDKSIEQRNSLYNLLANIEKVVNETQGSPLKECLVQILHSMPEGYQS